MAQTPPPPARQEDAGAAASPRPPPAHFPPMYSEQVSLSLGRAGRRQPMCSRLCRSRTAAAWGRRIARTPPSPAFRLKQQMAKLCLHLRALRAVPPGDAFWLAPLGLNAASSPLSYFPFLPSPPRSPPSSPNVVIVGIFLASLPSLKQTPPQVCSPSPGGHSPAHTHTAANHEL